MISNLFNVDRTALLALEPGEERAKVYGLRLINCTKAGAADAASILLSEGADANAQDEKGMTALHYAVVFGTRKCLRALVNSGKCNYLLKDNKGRYASELAFELGRDYAVGVLLSKKQVAQAYNQGVPAWSKAPAGLSLT